nr:GFA family protein [Rhizobium sp. Root482]
MDAWTGGCLCGNRRYRLRKAPAHVGYCHCSMCRKATGGASAILARISTRDLEWTGCPRAGSQGGRAGPGR